MKGEMYLKGFKPGDRRLLIFASIVLILFGCGSGSDAGKFFVPVSGHPGDWGNPLSVGAGSFHGTVVKNILSGPPGGVLFLRHCAACHGETGGGKIGPKIQGVSLAIIDGAIRLVPLMKGHSVLSEDERGKIAGYLATITVDADRAVAVIDTGVCMECHGEDLSGGVSRISCFTCHNGPKGDIGHPVGWSSAKENPVFFHGRYGKYFVASCTACHGVDFLGGIGPRCVSCHDGETAPLLPTFRL